MSILGNINKIIEEDDNNGAYTTPAVIRDEKNYISFKKALLLSTILHPAVVFFVWFIAIVLMLLGINLFVVDKPKPKMNDIEFVLVDREAMPINKKTQYRADINSRGGGKNDPKRKVSMPSPKPAKTQKPKASSRASKTPVKKNAVKSPSPKKSVAKPQPAKKASPQPAKTATAPKPAPPSVKPSPKPTAAPHVTTKPKTSFNVPVPPSASKGSLSTGPVGGSGSSSRHAGGSYSPTPSLAPTYKGTGTGSGTGSRGTSASRGGSGSYGNPSGGGGRPGIDAVAAPDFGPYMRDLQRRIKMNWDPPKGNESKRVVLLFKIARDGRLLSCSVYKSSGLQAADRAAINAVHATAPFRPLPANFKGSSVDIQFTFDYNVFGGSYR